MTKNYGQAQDIVQNMLLSNLKFLRTFTANIITKEGCTIIFPMVQFLWTRMA